MRRFIFKGDFIKLDDFLKASDLVSTGGEAKLLITEGKISVNDEVEFRRGRKLYYGDVVLYGKESLVLICGS